MIQILKDYLRAWRYKRAIRQANEFARLTKLKHYVIYLNGTFKVVSKKALKQLIRRKYFRKGVTIQDIERKALYVTN